MLDRGPGGMVIVYPSKTVTNARGDVITLPDMNSPVSFPVYKCTDRQSDAELPGQVSVKVIRLGTRSIPNIDSWARIEYEGELWDLAKPPTVSPGVSRATRHVEFTLRGRDNAREA